MKIQIEDIQLIIALISRFEQFNLELSETADDMIQLCFNTPKINQFISEIKFLGLNPFLPLFQDLHDLSRKTDNFVQDENIINEVRKKIKIIVDQFSKLKTFISEKSIAGNQTFIDYPLSIDVTPLVMPISDLQDDSDSVRPDQELLSLAMQNLYKDNCLFIDKIKKLLVKLSVHFNESSYKDLLENLENIQNNIDLFIISSESDFDENHYVNLLKGFIVKTINHFPLSGFNPDKSNETIQKLKEILPFAEELNNLFSQEKPLSFDPEDLEQIFLISEIIESPIIPDLIQNRETEETNSESPATLSANPNDIRKTDDVSFTKVKQEHLEEITNMIGELAVARSTLNFLETQLLTNESRENILANLKNTEKMFHRIITDLDQLVLNVRLQKIGDLFGRFPRLVRDLSKQQNKKIDLKMQGEDLELDNIILRQISDPLMHIIRNSCDHGIELPEERLKKGKPENGIIEMIAEIKNNKMNIIVRDNGKGLSVSKIKKKALEKNLITEDDVKKMTDKQFFNLILLPGFSTAEKVTEISGRGVGMDVVLQNLKKVKGEIIIDSEEDVFTKITFILPLNITISKGLMINIAQSSFIIPLENVISIENLNKDEIHSFQNGLFTKYKDQLVPVKSLKNVLFKTNPLDIQNEKIIVILKIESDLKGLIIDDVSGIQEISVKPLPEAIKDQILYRGCALMSDGKAVLVINPSPLFEER